MRPIYLIFFLILFSFSGWSNTTKRVWNYHLSKVQTYDVVKGNNKIYFLSEGGIFYLNKTDNSLNTITKINGLSGSDFSGIEYSYATNILVVFYKNSMVDIILDNGEIIPIYDIKRKNISGNKSIYSATCHNNLCYLSCGFGIVVLDLVKFEIQDSFIIGDNGKYDIVYDVAIDDENIYAGTPNGIKFAPLNATNLLDFSYWENLEHKNILDYNYNQVEFGAGRLWAVHQSDKWHGDKILSRHTPEIWYFEYPEVEDVISLNINGDMIVTCGEDPLGDKVVSVFQTNVGNIHSIKEYFFDDLDKTPLGTDTIEIDPYSAIMDDEGILWIADKNYGAIKYKDGKFDIVNPGGPIDNGSFSMYYSNKKLWVASGGRNSSWNNLYNPAIIQSYVFTDKKWESFSEFNNPFLENFFDVVKVVSSPGDPNHIFAATWGGGIIEFKNGTHTIYNEKNSSLQNILPGDYFLRVGGMDFDSKGNLWVSNSEVENCISMRKPDGTWKSYPTPEISYHYKIGELLVTKNDDIWVIVPRDKTNGLFIMSNDGKKSRSLFLKSYFSNGDEELIPDMNNIFCFAEDLEGDIWIGTSVGVAVFSNPEEVFTKTPYYSNQPGLEEGDGIYHPLLQNQTVTAIAVDGGNRKWCGTKGSGLFLISADGKEELDHFTVDNSNLISNGIISLEYDGDNGILYVGTDIGLVSFHTESKKSFAHFTDVYAYPNPVRSGYEGDIYISGMMENSNVKITTISGQLVNETTSIGGQATWDGRDMAGKRVHTGVYLVFCASKDGQESAVTKILFIR